MAKSGEADSGGRALPQNFPPEPEELGRAAARPGIESAGSFDQAAVFQEPPEVLLVQAQAGQGFDHSLELKEREGRREQLENDGAVFQFSAQPAESGRENSAVIEGHRLPEMRMCGKGTAASQWDSFRGPNGWLV
jgi:hypothetical protein